MGHAYDVELLETSVFYLEGNQKFSSIVVLTNGYHIETVIRL